MPVPQNRMACTVDQKEEGDAMRSIRYALTICALALAGCTRNPRGEFVGHLGHGSGVPGGHYYRNSTGGCQFCPFKDTTECEPVRFAHPHPLEEECLDYAQCRPVGCNPTGPIMR